MQRKLEKSNFREMLRYQEKVIERSRKVGTERDKLTIESSLNVIKWDRQVGEIKSDRNKKERWKREQEKIRSVRVGKKIRENLKIEELRKINRYEN